MNTNLYKVRYTTAKGYSHLGHVTAHTDSEAAVKAKRFIINGGEILRVDNVTA